MTSRTLRFLELAFLSAALVSCGGESNPVTPVNPTPTPTRPPVTGLVVQRSVSGILAGYTYVFFFHTNYRGDISGVLDWTFATTRMGALIVPGFDPCYTVDGEPLPRCPAVARADGFDKPLKATASNQPAGDYTLYVTNWSPDLESISYQVFLTSFELSPIGAVKAASPIAVETRGPVALRLEPPRF